MSKKFPKDKCKLNLKLSGTRIQLRIQKVDAANKAMEREIVELLKADKDSSARIKTELVLHNDNMLIALEYVANMVEMLKARLDVIADADGLTEDVATGVITVIYASTRVDVAELKELTKIFAAKYGKEWVKEVTAGNDAVPPRLVQALSTKPPADAIVSKRLYEIADKFGLTHADDGGEDEIPPPSAPGAGGSGSGGARRSSKGKGKAAAESDDFADLEARFAALQSPPK